MSRSNPTQNNSHPCTRWFEWQGERGEIRYYDRDKKENIVSPLPFTFMLLDKLALVDGWCDASNSGISSNEVRDTGKDPFVVKSFGGPVIAQGFYKDIKDKVSAAGGYYTANLYNAYKNGDGKLHLGSLKIHGAALNAWVEFEKANRNALFEKAITIDGYTEGKKGRIVFRMPVFKLVDISPETNEAATALDKQLQEYLAGYLKRNVKEQASTPAATETAAADAHAENMVGTAPIEEPPF
jgi:hypothetical protein